MLIDPSPLSVTPAVKSLAPEPGSEIQLPIRIARGSGVRGDVRVEVVAPQHYNDFRSEPIVVPRDQAQGTLTLRFGSKTRRFNAPLKIRATTQQSPSYVAETKVEL